jgi:hypothetical protein
MTPRQSPPLVLAVVAIVALISSLVQSQQPTVKVPDAGVPEIMTLEGNFVRGAYNNEGYAILGYRAANQSVGEEWMLLETGMTVRDGRSNFTLTRDALSLTTPDQKTIPLPSNAEYHQVDLRALEQRASVIRDSINYFPPSATRSCRIGFFAEVSSRAMAYDQVELSSQRGCMGRLYFKIPGGIQYGHHFLNIKFKESTVRVPFRILTKDEEKFLSKNFKDIRKQVQEAFKPKTKTN